MQIVNATSLKETASKHRYTIKLANSSSDVEAAQRLRYQVFFEEQRGIAPGNALDVDEYDSDCEHLLVRDEALSQVVGCYRIMRPEVAQRRGAFYSDSEFDLSPLRALRKNAVEVGRACIHPEFRAGSVIMLLWSGIARYMIENKYDHLIGCASINLADGHENAVAVYRRLAKQHLAPQEYRVTPRTPFPLENFETVEPIVGATVPPLLKGYTRMGAWICGAPAWDREFNSADLFVLMPMSRMPESYARHFLGVDEAA
jgi:putative hemolysin